MSKEQAIRLLTEVGAASCGENHAVYDCNGLHVHVQYTEQGDSLLLYVHLGFLPSHPTQQAFEYLLTMNFLGADTGGGHVGLHGKSRSLVYSLPLPVLQQDARSLRNALHLFAQRALRMLQAKNSRPAVAEGHVPEARGAMWG